MSVRKDEIARNLQEIRERIISAAKAVNRDPTEISLIVVTKTFPISDIEILAELGESNFGENRDQEAGPKAEVIPATWHFQGQIQSNHALVTTDIHHIDRFAIYSIKNELQILCGTVGVTGDLVRHAIPLNKMVDVFDALKTVKISKHDIQSN